MIYVFAGEISQYWGKYKCHTMNAKKYMRKAVYEPIPRIYRLKNIGKNLGPPI